MKKIILSAIAIISISAAANAQASATATATVNIVTPISIVNDVPMAFGNIAVSASAGGDVILAAAGTRTLGGTGVTLPAVAGTVTAAKFTVSGTAGYAYTVTLPTAAVALANGTNTMNATAFTSSLTSLTAGSLNASGTQSFTVGATLTVAAGQAAGLYTTANPFTVTVNYN